MSARYVMDIVTKDDAWSTGFVVDTPEELETRVTRIEKQLSHYHGDSAFIVHPVLIGTYEEEYFKEEE